MRRNNKETIKKEEEFDQRIIDVARVTRVMAGGKRMKFRICLAIGDKKGRVGIGIAKGADVTAGITKALNQAKKNLIKVPIVNDTIIHPIELKFKAAQILLKPAKKGSGIKAGGPLRTMCELAGIPNITTKILGSNNKINIAKATMLAFSGFKIGSKSATVKGIKDNDEIKNTDSKQEKKEIQEEKSKMNFKDKLKKIIKKDK